MDIASGSIAIASIAIQLVDSVQKLCEFIDTIKDIPDNLQRVRDELDVLQLVLTSVHQSIDATDPAEVVAPVQRSLDICRSRFDQLAGTAQGWQSGLDIGDCRRTWTRLAAAFGKKKIDGFAVQIEAAKSSVLLALQPYYHESHKREMAVVLTILRQLQVSSTPPVAPQPQMCLQWENDLTPPQASGDSISPRRPRYPRKLSRSFISKELTLVSVLWALYCGSRVNLPMSMRKAITELLPWGKLPQFGINYTTSTWKSRALALSTQSSSKDSTHDQYRTTVRALLPIFMNGFQISVTGSRHSMLPTRLEFHATIPIYSPTITYCIKGNLYALIAAVEEGRASVHDSTLSGTALLHIAAIHRQHLVCKFLLEAGADVNCVNTRGETPLFYAFKTFSSEDRFVQTTKALVEGGSDPMEVSSNEPGFKNSIFVQDYPKTGTFVLEAMMWLLCQEYSYIPSADKSSPHWWVLKRLVGSGVHRYRDKIKILLNQGVNIHCSPDEQDGETILTAVIQYGGQRNVDKWLQCLRETGFDLRLYLEREYSISGNRAATSVWSEISATQPFEGSIFYSIQYGHRLKPPTLAIRVLEDGALHWFNWGRYDEFIFCHRHIVAPCEHHHYYFNSSASNRIAIYYCKVCRSSEADLCEECYDRRNESRSRVNKIANLCQVNGVLQTHQWVKYPASAYEGNPWMAQTAAPPKAAPTPSDRVLHASPQLQNFT